MARQLLANILCWSTIAICSVIAVASDATTTLAPNKGSHNGFTCPTGFDLVKDGQCRGSAAKKVQWQWNSSLNKSIEVCGTVDAGPITINDTEQQNYWAAVVRSNAWTPLGIVCNVETKVWTWIDGSAVTYRPPKFNSALNSPCVPNAVFAIGDDGHWGYGLENSMYDFDFNCIADIRKPMLGNDNCFDIDDPTARCYQMSETPENWADAQKICASIAASLASVHSSEENAFIRRLAVSTGFTHGLFLGASISGKANNFGWVDGSDWDYTNFHPGFPATGYGDCVVMDTHDTTGEWVNDECSDPLNFVCSRLPFSEPDTTCPGPDTKEGAMIYTPGFPTDASIPCEFFLKVDSGKQVEVEIVLLEANSCCDRLRIYEGSFGDTLIAELTGSMSGAKYRTKSSNMMRVSWEPQGGVNVRGAIITFHGV